MTLDQFTELLTITFCLSGTHTGNVLQLIQCYRIDSSHRFQRRILEYHIGRNFQFFRELLPQIFQHWIKSRIHRTRATATCRCFLFSLFKVVIFSNLEWFRLLQKFVSLFRYLQKSIMFHVFAQVTSNQRLTDHRIPRLILFAHTGTEHLQVFMQMSLHFWSFSTL